jgi:hypothetical protein
MGHRQRGRQTKTISRLNLFRSIVSQLTNHKFTQKQNLGDESPKLVGVNELHSLARRQSTKQGREKIREVRLRKAECRCLMRVNS